MKRGWIASQWPCEAAASDPEDFGHTFGGHRGVRTRPFKDHFGGHFPYFSPPIWGKSQPPAVKGRFFIFPEGSDTFTPCNFTPLESRHFFFKHKCWGFLLDDDIKALKNGEPRNHQPFEKNNGDQGLPGFNPSKNAF